MDCGDRRIVDHLRHRVTPETIPLRGRAVGEDGDVTGGLVEPGELQLRILRDAFRSLSGARGGVSGNEISPDCSTAGRIVDDDKAPGLAQPDRGRQGGKLDQPLDRTRRQRIPAKPPYVASPGQQRPQALAKSLVESGR